VHTAQAMVMGQMIQGKPAGSSALNPIDTSLASCTSDAATQGSGEVLSPWHKVWVHATLAPVFTGIIIVAIIAM
jgi:hypothetical protein